MWWVVFFHGLVILLVSQEEVFMKKYTYKRPNTSQKRPESELSTLMEQTIKQQDMYCADEVEAQKRRAKQIQEAVTFG